MASAFQGCVEAVTEHLAQCQDQISISSLLCRLCIAFFLPVGEKIAERYFNSFFFFLCHIVTVGEAKLCESLVVNIYFWFCASLEYLRTALVTFPICHMPLFLLFTFLFSASLASSSKRNGYNGEAKNLSYKGIPPGCFYAQIHHSLSSQGVRD